MKSKILLKKFKRITVLIIATGITLFVESLGFMYFNKKVYAISMEHSEQQIEEMSFYIKKSLELELESYLHILAMMATCVKQENIFVSAEGNMFHEAQKFLGFEAIGIVDLYGADIRERMDAASYERMCSSIENKQRYISDIWEKDDEMFIFLAVPLKNKDDMGTILWAQLKVEKMIGDIQLDQDRYKYFQLVDHKGNYIISSKTDLGFAENGSMGKGAGWKELDDYAYLNGGNKQKIYENITKRMSGKFYFQEAGRVMYVSYFPFEVNDWYLFCVQEIDEEHSHISDIRRVGRHLWVISVIGLMLVCIAIYNFIYRLYRENIKHTQEMEMINGIFKAALKSTKDIPFFVNRELAQISFYGYPKRDVIATFSFADVMPQNLYKKGIILPDSLDEYNQIYQCIFDKWKTFVPTVIHVQIGSAKRWMRVRVAKDDQSSSGAKVYGVLENYDEQKEKEKRISDHLNDIKKIEKKAEIDYLTKLYNREAFIRRMNVMMGSVDPKNEYGALLIIDIDYFKKINDNMGHKTGDMLLKEVADTLYCFFRSEDVVGRLGGDEFVVFVKNIQEISLFEKRIGELNGLLNKCYHKDGEYIEISASIGIALTDEDCRTFDLLYERADEALYKVKEAGRNGYRIAEKSKDEK